MPDRGECGRSARWADRADLAACAVTDVPVRQPWWSGTRRVAVPAGSRYPPGRVGRRVGRTVSLGYRAPVSPSSPRARRDELVNRAELPDLTSLPGVQAGVEAARTAVTALRGHPALRRGREQVAAAAAVRAARASAALDGAPLALDRGDVGADAVAGPRPADPRPADPGPADPGPADPRLAGALRVAASLVELKPVWQRAPLQAMARLHVLAAADLAAADLLGRPRADPGIGPRLAALAEVVAAAPWPAPVMVAVVHGELLVLRPFGSADGVVARAAARLAMMTSGLDPDGLGVPEVAYLRSGPRYREAAQEFTSAGQRGLTAWVLLVCDALVAGAREGGSIADASG